MGDGFLLRGRQVQNLVKLGDLDQFHDGGSGMADHQLAPGILALAVGQKNGAEAGGINETDRIQVQDHVPEALIGQYGHFALHLRGYKRIQFGFLKAENDVLVLFVSAKLHVVEGLGQVYGFFKKYKVPVSTKWKHFRNQ